MSKHILRVRKTKKYTTISNCHLEDLNLSWKAKGIHTYILSKPDDWKVIIEQLITASTDGERSTRSGIQELYDHRYWQKYPVYIDGLIDHWETLVFEEPFDEVERIKNIKIINGEEIIAYVQSQESDQDEQIQLLVQNSKVGQNKENQLLCQNVEVGFVDIDNVDVENAGLLNTNILNTDYTNNLNQSVSTDGTNELAITIDEVAPTEPKLDATINIKEIHAGLAHIYGQNILSLAIARIKGKSVGKKGYQAYLSKVCAELKEINDSQSGISKPAKSNNQFHNFEQSILNYSNDELENILRNKNR